MTFPISVGQALAFLSAHPLVSQTETLPIRAALGRRLAYPVVAKVDRPFANLSAMDGYAVRLVDVASPNSTLEIVGEVAAGVAPQLSLVAGQAARIFTGAALPDGADHIVVQEDTTANGRYVTCDKAADMAQYIRHKGQDFSLGAEILPEGHVLSAMDLALIAAANLDMVTVIRKPRVAVLANGRELKSPGSTLSFGEIPNATTFGLIPLLESFGADVTDLGVAGDNVDAITSKITNADKFDLFVPCGGASVGAHDHMKAAFVGAGFETLFTKLKLRPGKPSWFATRGRQRVLGLPGNPASAFVCARLLIGPLLGEPWKDGFVNATLTHDLPAEGKRDHFMRGRARVSANATLEVDIDADQDSGRLLPFATANVLVFRPAGADAASAGELVQTLPIGPII